MREQVAHQVEAYDRIWVRIVDVEAPGTGLQRYVLAGAQEPCQLLLRRFAVALNSL